MLLTELISLRTIASSLNPLSTLRWLFGLLSSRKLACPAVLAVPSELPVIFAGVSVDTDC